MTCLYLAHAGSTRGAAGRMWMGVPSSTVRLTVAQPVMRPPDRLGQQGPGRVTAFTRREQHLEAHLDIRQVVAGWVVTDLLRPQRDPERLRLGPAGRQDVHVDQGAAADRGGAAARRG